MYIIRRIPGALISDHCLWVLEGIAMLYVRGFDTKSRFSIRLGLNEFDHIMPRH